ncbi:GntR family transcriptional regulator [Microbacterium sp. DT81.1]|uniref:GntR family transcriptional regulator n=1 Tax=Microbacterium sp. DT81.1 TaxID=3393413 RepID=UPI003CF7BA63
MPAATGTRRREIESWLREQVIGGREGDPLPSEAELAEKFGVSRMTARQAMQSLAAQGLVRRQRGSGTFIAPQPMHRHSGPLMSFTEDMKRRGLSASSRLITAELRDATAAEAGALRLEPGQRLVSLVRIRLADGQPMAIESTVLTPDCVPVLSHDLEQGSLHQALRELGRQPVTAVCRISAREATGKESALLDLPRRAAVLQEQRVISDQSERPLEFTTTNYAADRYVIDAVFTLTDPAPSA